MPSEGAAAPDDSLESIKRVTSAEAEVEAKVGQLRESVKSRIDALHRETETLLVQARLVAERERESTLAAARAAGDSEASHIVAEGADRARGIRGKSPAELAPKKETVLSAVLAGFQSRGKQSGD